jgi:hypothetical protein
VLSCLFPAVPRTDCKSARAVRSFNHGVRQF